MMRRIAFLLALTTALAAHAHAAGDRRTITVSNLVGAAESSFGIAIAGTPAGGLLVGAPVDSAASAQLFDATTGALLRIFPGPPLSYQFGISVEVFGDDVLVGDPSFLLGDVSAGRAFVGAVHRLDMATGTVEHTFLAPSPTAGAGFGRRLALRGGELLVAEIGAVHRYDLASNAFLGSFVAPAGSSPSGFGIGLVALGSLVAVGDPDANRVVVFDAATGAPVQTIPHPVPGEAAAFGRSLAVVDGDLLVGAPSAAGGVGAAYRIAVATAKVRTTYANPAPSVGDAFGYAVGTFGDAVVAGAPGDDLMEEGVHDGAAHVFDAASARLVAVLVGGGFDHLDSFGAAIEAVGDQVFVGSPDEDVNTVTGFRLDCGGPQACSPSDARLTRAHARLAGDAAELRARLRLTPAEVEELQASGGSVCLLGAPNLARCWFFLCGGDDRRLECPLNQGDVVLTRRRNGPTRLLATIGEIPIGEPTTGPLALRFNVGRGPGEATRAAALRKCDGGPGELRCR